MRFSNLFWACSSLAYITLGHAQSSKRQYDGHQVLRVETNGRPNAVLKRLASISLAPWKEETVGNHFDVVVPPEKFAEFESLNLRSTTLHADLGKSIAAESAPLSTWKRQADDLSWYDTYHPYEEHIQYFEDLQTLFPNNSELISSGTSYEGRDLFGIHLWGDAGPGKPAVLYHGTVHAREWITTLVMRPLSLLTKHKADQTRPRLLSILRCSSSTATRRVIIIRGLFWTALTFT